MLPLSLSLRINPPNKSELVCDSDLQDVLLKVITTEWMSSSDIISRILKEFKYVEEWSEFLALAMCKKSSLK